MLIHKDYYINVREQQVSDVITQQIGIETCGSDETLAVCQCLFSRTAMTGPDHEGGLYPLVLVGPSSRLYISMIMS